MRRFLHRIAIHVYGVISPERIPHRITPFELAEALAYYQLEPWGPERDTWHAAQIATACLQPWSKRRMRVKDQLLQFGKPDKQASSLTEKVTGLAMRMGWKINPPPAGGVPSR